MYGHFKPPRKKSLEERVASAAEAALAEEQQVTTATVLLRIGLIDPTNYRRWRQGLAPSLEEAMQAGLPKIRRVLHLVREFAVQRGLTAVETAYVRSTPAGDAALRFTAGAEEEIERQYRIHYLSPDLSPRQREKLATKASQAPETLVYQNLRDANCAKCAAPIPSGAMLTLDQGEPLCLACAGLGGWEFLPRGDAALTRRATAFSPRKVVVLRFSRTRKQYERQGLLVPAEALARAERSLIDSPPR